MAAKPKSAAGPMDLHLAADDLQALRDQLPHGVYRMPRNDEDDPVIVEIARRHGVAVPVLGHASCHIYRAVTS